MRDHGNELLDFIRDKEFFSKLSVFSSQKITRSIICFLVCSVRLALRDTVIIQL
jgi:hypothetical protein